MSISMHINFKEHLTQAEATSPVPGLIRTENDCTREKHIN